MNKLKELSFILVVFILGGLFGYLFVDGTALDIPVKNIVEVEIDTQYTGGVIYHHDTVVIVTYEFKDISDTILFLENLGE